MKPETLKALRASIRHWERMRDGKARRGEQPDWEHCPLCQMFNTDDDVYSQQNCRGCPVYEKTLSQYCIGSPWHTADKAFYAKQGFRKAAEAEVQFLKSLLPKTRRPTKKT